MIGYTLTDRAVKTLREMARKMQRPRPYVPPVPSRRISSPGGTGGDFRLVKVMLSAGAAGDAFSRCTYVYSLWDASVPGGQIPPESARLNPEGVNMSPEDRTVQFGRMHAAASLSYGAAFQGPPLEEPGPPDGGRTDLVWRLASAFDEYLYTTPCAANPEMRSLH